MQCGRCNADARMKIEFSVAALSLREKRSGTRLVRDLAKCRRFSRGSLRILFPSGLGIGKGQGIWVSGGILGKEWK